MTEISDEFDPNENPYEELDKELDGFALSDVDDFEKHPLWQNFIQSNARRIENFNLIIEIGDIELKVKLFPENYLGYKFRTNEAIRGALGEMRLTNVYLDDVRAIITATQEELQSQQEEEVQEDAD